MAQQTFYIGNETYIATSEVVDTDYGPENKVVITTERGEQVAKFQEPMSTESIIQVFKEDLWTGE